MTTFFYDLEEYKIRFNSSIREPEQHTLKVAMQTVLNEISDIIDKLRVSVTSLKNEVVDKLLEHNGFLSSDVFLEEESPGKCFKNNRILLFC